MASGKGLLVNALGRLILRESVIRSIHEISEHVRAIELAGEGLKGASWIAGDKLQLLLPSLEMRTYTPVRWDRSGGVTELVVYHHGETPGARWCRAAKPGDRCRFVGPQRSLRWDPARPALLFGDETSYAVAQALARAATSTIGFVFEVGSTLEADRVFAATKLEAVTVERGAQDRHLAEVARHVRGVLARQPGTQLLLTGRAQSIQSIRSLLRTDNGPRPDATKAYWAVGKVGLD
ncbi:MAG: siderophore-interacting protein [Kofleriaceae bacterium]